MSRNASHRPGGFFALRTPLLPFAEWLGWSAGLRAPEARGDVARVEEALARDRAGLRQKLREQLARPELRDALFVASPELEASLPIWLEQPESERGQKIERALVRYFARMAVRPTPFGLFAGCSLGRVGAQTRLSLAGRATYQRHTRLDMDYLFALSEALGRDPALRAALKYRPGSSLYRAAGRLRYAQARLDGKARSHHLVAVEPADYLLETLQRAQGGATVAELARALVTDEIPLEEAEAFIGQLIDAQLLESELPPAVTGPEPVHGMISLLRGFDTGRGVAEVLDGTRQALEALDRDGLGAPPSRYRDVARGLEPLPAKAELPRLFQVDLVKPAPEATLGPAVLAEMWRGVELLHAVVGEAEEALDRFREAFTQRYEGREVPLLEALDEEAGVGFGTSRALADASPLLQGLPLPSPEEPEAAPASAWTRLLLAKLDQAVREGSLEVTLDAPELEALRRKDTPPLPDALSVLATLVGPPERIAEGDFLLCVEGASSSPARLLGRFCHADPELHREVEALLREEEALRPDAVFAEIVHLPEGRVGNVLCRPVLRPYELPYLGHSGAPEEARIPPSDLRVRVVDGRIVLRSAKLDREVLPRLSSAHNYNAHSVTVYRFLCMLQDQGAATGLSWSWGPLSRAPFLPRVRSGRVVLARARWRLEKPVLRALGGLRGAALLSEVRGLRERLRLPRRASLVDADNLLPLDFENALCLETFAQLVKERDFVVLEELLADEGTLCAVGPEGAFTHELVVPFLARPSPPRARSRTDRPKPEGPRTFPPGSSWLYAKLYTGSASADALLREHLGPLVREVVGSGAAERWFFIRYGDPDWHLRLRFGGEPRRLLAEVMPRLNELCEPLLREGLMRRLVLDTYEREVERYGGDGGVLLAERLFHHDSDAVLALVGMLPGDEGADARWRLALRGADLLMADLGLGLDARLRVMRQAREGLAREHRVDGAFEERLSAKYRKERKALETLLWSAGEDHPYEPGLAVLRQRSEALRPVVAELSALERDGRLTESLEELAGSFVHMHVNRLLRAAHRAQELVIYDFLGRLYESRIARARRSGDEG